MPLDVLELAAGRGGPAGSMGAKTEFLLIGKGAWPSLNANYKVFLISACQNRTTKLCSHNWMRMAAWLCEGVAASELGVSANRNRMVISRFRTPTIYALSRCV